MEPRQGKRFQPTGFPDLGHAEYRTKDGMSVLVDSHQSVANHLEAAMLDDSKEQFVDALQGLSKVNVVDSNGRQITNSVREGHRLASPYILDSPDTEVMDAFEALDVKKKPLAKMEDITNKIIEYDANSLLHGLWMSRVNEGRIKIARALSAFIEADGVEGANSGGIKWDHVTTSTKSKDGDKVADKKDSKGGYGPQPHARVDYTAKKITAYFGLDLVQIRGYRLDRKKTDLLQTLALWKIRKFVDSPYRPRSFCDLKVSKIDGDLPAIKDLDSKVKELIKSCNFQETDVKYKG